MIWTLIRGAAPLVVAASVGAAGGAWLTNAVKGAQLAAARADLARAEQRYTAQQLAQAEAASIAMYQAQRRGDVLTRDLAAAQRAANQLKQERDDALSRVTDGRDCLREPALRVLDGAPGIGLRLPGPAGGADGAHAGHVATDTDLARWALDAGSQYAECARRLDALIDWHSPAPEARP